MRASSVKLHVILLLSVVSTFLFSEVCSLSCSSEKGSVRVKCVSICRSVYLWTLPCSKHTHMILACENSLNIHCPTSFLLWHQWILVLLVSMYKKIKRNLDKCYMYTSIYWFCQQKPVINTAAFRSHKCLCDVIVQMKWCNGGFSEESIIFHEVIVYLAVCMKQRYCLLSP